MQNEIVLKKLHFDLLTPRVRGGVPAKYLLLCCCICDSLLFDMQHDHVLKSLIFDLMTPSPGGRGMDRGLGAKYLLPCCCIL